MADQILIGDIRGKSGNRGQTGSTPTIDASINNLPAGSTPTVNVSGSVDNPLITFGIPIVSVEVNSAIATNGMGWTDEDNVIHKIDEKYMPEEISQYIIKSSTPDSIKKFAITVDDTGAITATEII